MKPVFLFLICLFNFLTCFSQGWTLQQLQAANTASAVTVLIQVEKEAIMYLNLARLYPKLFAEIEVKNYFGTARYVDYVKNSGYRQSLIADLLKRDPVKKLYFDSALYSFAKCFSHESGERGITGHERINCADAEGRFAECCSYGMETGRDIILQLLIDDEIRGTGHRTICLDNDYSKIGLSVSAHKTWDFCAILDFSY